jgi:hypothetical protein
MHMIIKKFKNDFFSIVTLAAIVTAFIVTTWRAEISEKNQNLRMAGFEILKNLGQLQIVVNYAYYQPDNVGGNPYLGWGYIALVSDLSQLMPHPVLETIQKLVIVWGDEANNLKTRKEAVEQISLQIDNSRKAVLKSIHSLH